MTDNKKSRPYREFFAKRQTASTYLNALEKIGLLEEEKVGRDKIFIHRKYLDLLSSDEHTFAPYLRNSEKDLKGR